MFVRFFAALAAILFLPAVIRAADRQYPASLVAPTEALTPQEEQQKFHLPEGFVIELVVSEPQIHKPMNLAFDGRGRLYVTSSLEYPFPAKQGMPSRDTLHVLSDSDGGGRYDRTTQVVGGLNIPIGVTPVADGAIYYNIPSIYRWTGDVDTPHQQPGKLLYGTFGFNDTHGMANSFTPWLDGWIYACHGFANTSQVKGADEKAFSMQSGNTFRMRADGSHAEQNTHGQVNPFGLCFDPLGSLYSADCHTLPIYQLLRGAYYPSFGKPHDGLGFGPTMIGHNHGSTGIAGVVYYAADQFPDEYRDTVFIGNPVTGRVNHDRLAWHGSSPQAIEQPDFISCDDPWFRPVDLKLGPDGALYIADFYNCIIGHYEVPLTHPRRDRERGRIWKVTYREQGTGNRKQKEEIGRMPDLATKSTDELVTFLGHPNLTMRVLATEEVVGRDPLPDAGALLREGTGDADIYHRAHGLWIIERRTPGGLPLDVVRRLADDPSPLVRVHVVKALAERPVWAELSLAHLVRAKLADGDPFVRRAAADALGRHPESASIEPLFKLWRETPADDTHLIHVVRMALRDHLLTPGMYSQIAASAADVDNASRFADVSLGVHTAEAAEYLLSYIGKTPIDAARTPLYLHEIARYLPDERLGEVYRWLTGTDHEDLHLAREFGLVLHRAAQERGTPDPAPLITYATDVARRLLVSDEPPQVQGGAELARELRLTALEKELTAVAAAVSRPLEMRSAAIEACVRNDAEKAIPLLAQILGNAGEPIVLRQKAAGALASANVSAAREALLAPLRTAPDQLAIEIAAGLAQQKEGGETLLAEVATGRASPRLLQERTVQERLRKASIPDIEARLQKLTADLPAADERINQLIAVRRDSFGKVTPDAALGREVFKKHCAACHRVGSDGGKVGPDLDGVGLRGADRLLEDVLDPSRNVDQAFRSTLIQTSDGRSVSGLVLREEGAVLVLADSQGNEVRVPLAEIDERAVSALSPMPANVADLVPEGDFYHLLAFLLAQRQKAQTQTGR